MKLLRVRDLKIISLQTCSGSAMKPEQELSREIREHQEEENKGPSKRERAYGGKKEQGKNASKNLNDKWSGTTQPVCRAVTHVQQCVLGVLASPR